MKQTQFILLLLLLINSALLAQDKAILHLEILPRNAFVKIDNQVYNLNQQSNSFGIELAPGNYTIEIWAPEYETHSETINIIANKKNIYKKTLTDLTANFMQYQEELKSYNRKKLQIYTGSVVFHTALAFGIIDIRKVNQLKREEQVILNGQVLYQQSFTTNDLSQFKTEHNDLINEYNRQKKNLRTKRIIGGALACATIASTFVFAKKAKAKRPTYSAENPLVLQSINLDSDTYQNVALSLKFNF